MVWTDLSLHGQIDYEMELLREPRVAVAEHQLLGSWKFC